MNYILKDHIGSINYVLNSAGSIIEEMNFDAWGNRRNASNWSYTNVPEHYTFDRGYTLHSLFRTCFGKHLNDFKLINMNGRVYDPVIARFLSPDPVLQMPEYSQNFNRYSYVLNNPLKFTDPSGFVIEGDENEYQPNDDENLPWWMSLLTDFSGQFSKAFDKGFSATAEALFGQNKMGFMRDNSTQTKSLDVSRNTSYAIGEINDLAYQLPSSVRLNMATMPGLSHFPVTHYPDAVSYTNSPNVDFVLGTGVDITSDISILMLNGPNTGFFNKNGLSDGGLAVGFDIGLSYVYTEYYYLGDINDFRYNDLLGNRTSVSGGFSIGLEAGQGAVFAFPRKGAMIIGVSYYIGISPPGFSGNVNYGSTIDVKQ